MVITLPRLKQDNGAIFVVADAEPFRWVLPDPPTFKSWPRKYHAVPAEAKRTPPPRFDRPAYGIGKGTVSTQVVTPEESCCATWVDADGFTRLDVRASYQSREHQLRRVARLSRGLQDRKAGAVQRMKPKVRQALEQCQNLDLYEPVKNERGEWMPVVRLGAA